jgi:hypothetical protein
VPQDGAAATTTPEEEQFTIYASVLVALGNLWFEKSQVHPQVPGGLGFHPLGVQRTERVEKKKCTSLEFVPMPGPAK